MNGTGEISLRNLEISCFLYLTPNLKNNFDWLSLLGRSTKATRGTKRGRMPLNYPIIHQTPLLLDLSNSRSRKLAALTSTPTPRKTLPAVQGSLVKPALRGATKLPDGWCEQRQYYKKREKCGRARELECRCRNMRYLCRAAARQDALWPSYQEGTHVLY